MSEYNPISRRELLKLMTAGLGLVVFPLGALASGNRKPAARGEVGAFWAYAVDTTRCIGCCACMRACRDENSVPEGAFRTWVLTTCSLIFPFEYLNFIIGICL